MIDQILTSGALPALEATMSFAARRHELIAHNIANIDTPRFRTLDVEPAHFQALLADAVDRRRSGTLGTHGALEMKSSRQIGTSPSGSLMLEPGTDSGNVLFHDRNNRDLERLMQDLAENTTAFRQASDLMRQQMGLIRGAIGERVT